ncbi:MAG: glycoside hydrolase family 1 protein [Sphingomonas sp.]|uniref:glycoside hydrolase family 1 protein n=1 Tax=Sphingomonas sp. TaxID=28214 RepID=UPI001AC11FE3|nr:family 1 glycosylhydrolase [Sphingomonas sp.]MBN8816286.1 glycoside hydrolase family 1 protein [Sphingomonas sp.]
MDRRDLLIGLGATAALSAQPSQATAPRARAAKKDFLWGTAISAHQSEGNNVNSDGWLNEHIKPTLYKEPSGDACDSYERFGEDIALAASLGFNAHRFGIEWARIEPEPGQFSMAALDHYKRVLEACRAHNLKPMVTFMHFTTPRWFAARGGFEADGAPDLFARFADKAARHFGSLPAFATTFNEINIQQLIRVLIPSIDQARPLIDAMFAASAKACGSDTFRSWAFADAEKIAGPTHVAHAKAYQAIKAAGGGYPVGISISVQDLQPLPGGEAGVKELQRTIYGQWLDSSTPADFIGVQPYTRILIGPDGVVPPAKDAVMTDAGYENYPAALGNTLRYVAKATGKPVFASESGIAADDDRIRIKFIDETMAELRKVIAEGVDVRGYFHWSLLDNFEWTSGYAKHFGLVAVDRTTFKRTPKPSAYHLGRIARAGIA